MLEDWQYDTALPEANTQSASERVLTSTSGNAQLISQEVKDGPQSSEPSEAKGLAIPHPVRCYPAPKTTLGSSNVHKHNQQTRAVRKLRQRMQVARAYLNSPGYQRYKERVRRDVMKNGEVVWSDDVEEAFHNALVNIPPMGKRKKSQHGRAFGRNELISEWIKHETGKDRDRKQVSSHLQQLGICLKDVTAWRIIKTFDTSKSSEFDINDYYDNSVEDMVRRYHHLKNSSSTTTAIGHENVMAPYILRSNDTSESRLRLSQLEFEMWVSTGASPDLALHKYTTAQSSVSASPPSPLEGVAGWRLKFPGLAGIIESLSSVEICDIVLLNCSFRLMTDFPPQGSKLRIKLNLEFSGAGCRDIDSPRCFDTWGCLTHIYQRGKLLHHTEERRCQVSGVGQIKPPFESIWWAHEFVRLTDKSKMAQHSANDAGIAAASESTRNYLSGLTMMQQISSYSGSCGPSDNVWMDEPGQRARTAVLLWTFSQAPDQFVGTTTWHKVIPPPPRITTNSPLPLVDMSLPPLELDSTLVGDIHDPDSIDAPLEYMQTQHALQQPFHGPQIDENELCQDRFTMQGQRRDFDMVTALDLAGPPNGLCQPDLTGFDGFDFDLAQAQVVNFGPDMAHPESTQNGASNNLFENQAVLKLYADMSLADVHASRSHSLPFEVDTRQAGGPLANFDASTHEMLQAQLDKVQNDIPVDLEEDRQRQSDETAVTESLEQMTGNLPGSTPTSFIASIAGRPQLQAHHSFAGVLPTDDSGLTPTARQDFARLLESMEHYEDMFDEHGLLKSPTFIPLVRPHSQPAALIRHEQLAVSAFEHSDIDNGHFRSHAA